VNQESVKVLPVPHKHVWGIWKIERDSRPSDPQVRACLICDAREVERLTGGDAGPEGT